MPASMWARMPMLRILFMGIEASLGMRSAALAGCGRCLQVSVFFIKFSQNRQAGFAGTRVKMVKQDLRHGVCCVRQLNILLALNEIIHDA